MRKTWRFAAASLFLLAIVAGAFVGDGLLALSDHTRDRLRLYTELLETSQEAYGAEVSYEDLVFASIRGMLRGLDPHTNFLSPDAYTSMRDRQQGSFYGLGILVGVRDGKLTVITPIPGSPADRLGMRAGDVISLIEGDPTETMTLDEAVGRLKGPKDTKVNITVVRRGLEEPLELAITRAEVTQDTVSYEYMLDDETGYVAIRDFARTTSREVAEALRRLKGEGMKRLVLDLRNNGGGLLDQAIEVADQFVPGESKIVETRGRIRSSYSTYSSSGKYAELGLPLVVIVNGGTASAAEILSGAIQDHDVGLVVGEPTWGKGLVQTVYTLPYGAGIALTTAKYYTPSGRLIQRDYSSYWDYYADYGRDDEVEVEGDGEGEKAEAAREPGDVYATDLGRKVYGGGGITPDVASEMGPQPDFIQFLRARAAFLNFAVDYLRDAPVKEKTWQPDDAVFDRLVTWLKQESIGTPEEIDAAFTEPEARRLAMLEIRYEVFNAAFGVTEGHRVRSLGDDQLQKALTLFDEARELLETREAIKATRKGAQVADGRAESESLP
jgi:carboxyl-terminal processing protease